MTAVIATVRDFLAAGGELCTRLRERSVGETHDFPSPVLTGLARTLRAEDIVVALEILERQGGAVRSETVHAYDSSEYAVHWRFVTSACC